MLVPPLYEARVNDWIRHGIERRLGLSHVTADEIREGACARRCPSFEGIIQCTHGLERTPAIPRALFDYARSDRYAMGHLRYATYGRPFYDVIGSALARLTDYVERDHNLEHLVDVANLCAIEWSFPFREGTRWEYHLQVVVPRGNLAPFDPRTLLRSYQTSGLRNYLPAVAAWCGFEFCAPTIKGAHFTAADMGGHWSLKCEDT